jgi:hypothetical protein
MVSTLAHEGLFSKRLVYILVYQMGATIVEPQKLC